MPILTCITHMFWCGSLARVMDWHSCNCSTDGTLCISADGKAWRHIEKKWPEFGLEPWHLCLGLAMDGINPFGHQSTSWLMWLVVVTIYNILAWLTIKKGHLMLALIVPEKHKVKNVNMYLAPLIDELHTLWNGLQVYDISRSLDKCHFQLKGILIWTMHDYPGFHNCLGII